MDPEKGWKVYCTRKHKHEHTCCRHTHVHSHIHIQAHSYTLLDLLWLMLYPIDNVKHHDEHVHVIQFKALNSMTPHNYMYIQESGDVTHHILIARCDQATITAFFRSDFSSDFSSLIMRSQENSIFRSFGVILCNLL